MPEATKRALLVIDVQNDYDGGNLPIVYPPLAESLAKIGRAMDGARAAGVPVVVVQHFNPESAPFMARGSVGAELHPVVASRPRDHFLEKGLPDAFTNTGLAEWLRQRGVNTVTVVGFMSHNCDLATVLHGMHAGFAMEFLADASGSLPYANRAGSASGEEIHRVVCVVMQSRFAAVLATEEWLACLQNTTTPERDTIFASNRRARGKGGLL